MQLKHVAASAETASDFMVSRSFNLNSTNPEAWRAVLLGLGTGGLNYAFDYTVHDDDSGDVVSVSTQTINRTIARFSQSAGKMWEVSPDKNNYLAPLRQYRRGVRGLTVAQVAGLAVEIATNVRRRGAAAGPFRSVEEFLETDASVPDSERINWDQYFPDSPMKMDRAAPSDVTSADLMTGLAPLVNVRSDTFVIRAYGEVLYPVTPDDFLNSAPVAKAWLEAVAQRFPEGVDVADFTRVEVTEWTQMVADPRWGRRLRILSLRWLDEDEL
ncbi:MAG: hypothetical protein J6386_01030 [Candidatus Synoicihabitans palmerolidicus]|nr:hypothetical protein [Candidatus Synoicihabitans palmerolidicus]